MNDVKISNVDFAAKQQGSAASSSPPTSVERQASVQAPDSLDQQSELRAKRSQELNDQAREGSQTVKEAITRLNDYVQSVQRDLQFQLDDTSGKTVVTVIDRQTSEVVRQIPDEVALRLAQDLQQDEPLSLFDAKA